ncbi:MAG: SDR family NAD(P)-dependent oxidoreductase [Gemmatimonadaceae bacterium]
MDFTNTLAVLTGVGRAGQVGEVVARAFADRGADLVLIDRTPDGVQARAAEISSATGRRAWGHAVDLTDGDAVQRLAASAVAAARGDGRVHALVNLAGGFVSGGPVGESDLALLERMVAINLTTAFSATRAFLPFLRAAAAAGRDAGGASVVYFGSAAALPDGAAAGIGAYAAAKSGVLALMRAVAEEERDAGIRANALAPTMIRTGANLRAMGDAPGVRYVEREAVADAVLFLCSAAARNVTGQVLKLE